MKLLQHYEDQQPTLMHDVFSHYIGKSVLVYTTGGHVLPGVLKDFNGYVLHLCNNNDNYYLFTTQVDALSSKE